jgi:hypothetical protein
MGLKSWEMVSVTPRVAGVYESIFSVANNGADSSRVLPSVDSLTGWLISDSLLPRVCIETLIRARNHLSNTLNGTFLQVYHAEGRLYLWIDASKKSF